MLDLDRFLPYLVNVLASRLSRELAAIYEAQFGVSIPEWRLIAHLAQNGNISVREIHERVDRTRPRSAAPRRIWRRWAFSRRRSTRTTVGFSRYA